MPDYKSPGVYVEEVSSGNKPIESVSSSVAGFLGEGAVGPLNEPVPLANWAQFTKHFGGFEHSPFLAHSIYQWFANGGGLCFVSLVGRPDDPNDASKKGVSKAGLFIGEDAGPGKRSGLHAFNPIRDISLVVAPGQSDPAIHDAVLTHCEVMRDRFAILDCPEELGQTLDQMYRPRDSTYGAYYFPWLQVFDPVSKQNKFIPPSGPVSGIFARTDAERGVHKAPANELVRGALGLKYSLTSSEQALLNPRGINLIRDMGDRGIRVWGARTLSTDPEWRYINVRRLFLVIEQSIMNGTQWAVFEPNDQNLWKKLVRNVRAYLLTVWRSGALFGESPEQAFYVKCDSETNPPELIDLGQVNIEIGVAPVKPAEFVIFKIGQMAAGG